MRWPFPLLLKSAPLLLCLVAGTPALAALTEVGPAIDPHGYPHYYGDANGLRLQLCQDGDGVGGYCIFDPVDPANPESVALGVGDESFWWMANAFINENTADVPDPKGLDAEIVMALEGAFGGIGVASDGSQIAFGRIRIRIDTPAPGTYTVTHPYGIEVFENVPAGIRAINVTKDIGAINVLNPAEGFAGALRAQIGPFLTWPDYLLEPTLAVQVLDGGGIPTGEIIQYVGNPQVPHPVTGSLFTEPGAAGPANYFRVQGPNGLDLRTELFEVMGKVLPDPPPAATAHVFPAPPPVNLYAVGPVNRIVPFTDPTTGTVTGFEVPGYPIGFPLWYQENAGTQQNPAGGLRLAICPPSDLDPMCISAPRDPQDPASLALGVGEEAFWWSAESFINDQTADIGALPPGLDGQLTLALEAAFGGTGAVNDGDQVAFGRVRVRFNVPADGTYTITHPYGVEVLENVTAAEGINFTRDLGVIDPRDPDGSFIGALYSDIGPTFLTWTGFAQNPALKIGDTYYVGDPTVPHAVSGSMFVPAGETEPANYFRIQGPGGIDVSTALFVVTGKVFDPLSVPLTLPTSLCVYEAGTWYLDGNGNGIWDGAQGGPDASYRFGTATMKPVSGDWDGDGLLELGAYDNGTWYLDLNGNGIWDGNGIDATHVFGTGSMKPVAGDWDGNGTHEIGAYENGTWYLDLNGNGSWDGNGTDAIAVFGTAAMIPVPGDWDGDGIFELGVYENGTWYLDSNGNRSWDGAGPGLDRLASFGTAAMQPVAGDWNGDGRDEIGAYENGSWYFDMDGSASWTAADRVATFGFAGAQATACVAAGGGNQAGGGNNTQNVAATTFVTSLLPDFGGTFSAAIAINASGIAAGLADDGTSIKAARWTATGPGPVPAATALEPLAGFDYSAAYAISDAGTIVGESENGAEIAAVYWPANSTAAIALNRDGLVAGDSAAYAVNAAGQIAGEAARDSDGNTVALYWGNGTATPLALDDLSLDSSSTAYGIDGNGLIVGQSRDAAGEFQAVVWRPSPVGGYEEPIALPELAGQVAGTAFAIDPFGRIVGEAEMANGSVHGVVWILNAQRNAVVITQDLGAGTSALAINGRNRLVGTRLPGSGSDRAAAWNGANFGDTANLASPFSQAYGINDNSQAVGVSGTAAFISAPQ